MRLSVCLFGFLNGFWFSFDYSGTFIYTNIRMRKDFFVCFVVCADLAPKLQNRFRWNLLSFYPGNHPFVSPQARPLLNIGLPQRSLRHPHPVGFSNFNQVVSPPCRRPAYASSPVCGRHSRILHPWQIPGIPPYKKRFICL